MATTTARRQRSLFGEILKGELDLQKVSTRELARRLAESPEKIENVRRTLIRYIRGEVLPGEQAREAIASALSIDPEVFAEDADRAAKRERVLDALAPLADVLLELVIDLRNEKR
jgi:transcriptional regulator with XRE-family HTH domain